MQHTQIHNGFFIVLSKGEDLFSTLVQFCEQQDVHWGQFQAIGALENVEIGYYDLPTKEYVFRQEAGPFEVASLDGNISELGEEAPFVHAHAVLARCDETLECVGGHLRRATVALTLEVCLWQVTQPLLRRFDDETGLNLLRI
jgi:predicted DNA-binding protein with PD1-like motif